MAYLYGRISRGLRGQRTLPLGGCEGLQSASLLSALDFQSEPLYEGHPETQWLLVVRGGEDL